MNHYLFVNYHNGHKTTYHPFVSNVEWTNDYCMELQKKHCRGAERMGTSLEDILSLIVNEGGVVDDWIDPIFKIKTNQIYTVCFNDWIVLHGISGNY